MSKRQFIKPEPVTVQGICVRCHEKPQGRRGIGKYRALCTSCEYYARFEALPSDPKPPKKKEKAILPDTPQSNNSTGVRGLSWSGTSWQGRLYHDYCYHQFGSQDKDQVIAWLTELRAKLKLKAQSQRSPKPKR